MRYEPDEIIRSRRRTLALEIKKDGRFVVRAPYHAGVQEINEFLDSKQAWIAKTLEKCSLRMSRALNVDFKQKSTFPFLGRMIGLDYHDGRSLKLCGADILNRLPADEPSDFRLLKDVTLLLPSPAFRRDGIALGSVPCTPEKEAEENRRLVSSWYRRQAASILKARTALYAARMGLEPRRVSVTKARTCWGSCNAKCGINYSLHLICVSIREIDYVVVHELSHIRHRDHSAAFYAEIEKILPDHKKRSAALEQDSWVLDL